MSASTSVQIVRVEGKPCCSACLQALPEPYVYLSPVQRLIYNKIKKTPLNQNQLLQAVKGSVSDLNSLRVNLYNLRARLVGSGYSIPKVKKTEPLRVVCDFASEEKRPLPTYLKEI